VSVADNDVCPQCRETTPEDSEKNLSPVVSVCDKLFGIQCRECSRYHFALGWMPGKMSPYSICECGAVYTVKNTFFATLFIFGSFILFGSLRDTVFPPPYNLIQKVMIVFLISAYICIMLPRLIRLEKYDYTD
jgi:hypothetical protein